MAIIYLKPQPHDIVKGGEAADLGGGAGAPEIEVTPAMIDAGAELLTFYDPETDRLRDTVFRAMLEARPSQAQ
jgi:hypothetical protein